MTYRLILQTLYEKDFPVISTTTAQAGDYFFLDAREWEEYNTSHIKDARYVGYVDFKLEGLKDISKEERIVVYCSIGVRSQEIGTKLKEAGYTHVFNLYGGIFQWINDGLPVFDDKGQTNQVHAYSRMWGMWLQKGDKVYD